MCYYCFSAMFWDQNASASHVEFYQLKPEREMSGIDVAWLDLNQILILKFRFNVSVFHNHIHVRAELSELTILTSIDNNRVNYVPTQFRYL